MSTRSRKTMLMWSRARPVRKAGKPCRHLWACCVDNVGFLTSHKPTGLRRLLRGQLYFHFFFYFTTRHNIINHKFNKMNSWFGKKWSYLAGRMLQNVNCTPLSTRSTVESAIKCSDPFHYAHARTFAFVVTLQTFPAGRNIDFDVNNSAHSDSWPAQPC
jgi:hypothetical protein